MELDTLDRKAADSFTGLVVRKDLVRQFRGQFPVPTYVVEFMLGRYCATTDEQEIALLKAVVRWKPVGTSQTSKPTDHPP